MTATTRRRFLASAALTAASGLAARSASPRPAPSRLMTIDLTWGAVGIEADQREAIELAARHGFESVAADGGALERMSASEVGEIQALLSARGLVWGAAGLPVNFRGDDEAFRQTSQGFEEYAAGLRRAGVTRVGTWITPASDTLTYRRYFDVVASRLRRTARVLHNEGIRLGLEYVAPQTSYTARKYPFIHTLAETQELVEAIDVPGVGYVLDSWHWYLAGDTVEQLTALRNEDVVAVDLNDAPAGVPKEEQMDLSRELPMATGVIPLGDFMGALRDIGYDGPCRAEPFNKALNALGNEEAAAATVAALQKAFALVR